MRKVLISLILLSISSNISFAQQPLQDIRKKSYQALVYRISADTAEQYLNRGIKAIDQYLQQQPAFNFPADTIDYDKIPVGNYLFISVVDSMVEARFYCQTKVLPFVVNNQVQPQLLLRNEEGTVFKNARVFVHGKLAKFNEASSVYLIRNKKPDEALIRIELPGDTSFAEISIDRENYNTIGKQLSARFRASKTGKILCWIPDKVTNILKRNIGYGYDRRKSNNNWLDGKGYVIFNKPKYFPSDTIRFKAYLLNKHGKPYKNKVNVFLNYSNRESYVSKQITSLQPVSKGAYTYEFATGDTLPNDTRFTIQFKRENKKALFNGYFSIEDYLPDEVTTYSISSMKEKYYRGDTLEFSAVAKDANGLALMDGKVKLVLLAEQINNFNKPRVFVPDTLWQKEIPLAIEGDTKFLIPSDIFPKADITIKVIAVFRNSNNEIQQKEITTDYVSTNTKIDIYTEGGLINAVLYKNGVSVKAKGFMETDLTDEPVQIDFPYSGKIDPQTEEYDFYTGNKKEKDEWEEFDVPNNYTVSFNRIQHEDSVAFVLNNPNKIPVYYSLFDKDRAVYSASSSDEYITWKGMIPRNKIYYLRWQYYWAGEEKYGNENIGLLSKLASAEINAKDVVYPGQTDTISVKVKDYKQRNLRNVNLIAVSYNSQLAKDIHVPEPPYIQKFRGKKPLLHDWYESDMASLKQNFSLGKHQEWRKQFSLDTMPYYKFLFPTSYYQMVKTRINEVLPQVSVYVVKNGVPQEIYLVYMNRQLVYYNGVTDRSVYSVSRLPGYTQFAIRLKNKYIEIDSIYLQPFFKHDIIFDIDKKEPGFKVRDTADYWTWQEKEILNNQVLRIENNYKNNSGYIWQDDKAFYLGDNQEHLIGPFVNYDSIQFFKPGDFDMKFSFEPGYRYRISPQMVRLEKIRLFPADKKVRLISNSGVWWPLGDTIKALPVISYESAKVQLPFLEQRGNNYRTALAKSCIKLQIPSDSTIAFTVLQNNELESDYRVIWGKTDILYNVGKGNYAVVLVTDHFNYVEAANIQVDNQGTYCIKFVSDDKPGLKPVFKSSNYTIANIVRLQQEEFKAEEERLFQKQAENDAKKEEYKNPLMNLPAGTGVLSGKITDKKGEDAIACVSVVLKGYKTGTVSKADGTYILRGIPAGSYVVKFASVGYKSKERNVMIYEGQNTGMDAELEMSQNNLQEVVVVGYGTAKRKDLTGSVSVIRQESLTQALQGKAAGVTVTANGIPGADASIRIRGVSSVNGNTEPLIIVDGMPVDKMPTDLSADEISCTSVIRDASAVTLYGTRATNGVIIITTKGFNPKILRDSFRDYAVWKPNLITDANGEAQFTVTYPDNITSWQTFVVGMDKQHHILKSTKLVKSFKPMLAQLSVPQFLVEGDTAIAIGKKINYTNSPINATIDFSLHNKPMSSSTELIKPNDAAISEYKIAAAPDEDSITARFSMKADNGFADGEQRKIPILRKGTDETIGQFNILEGDTSVNVSVNREADAVTLHAQNNTLDMFLSEIDHLKDYPYYCMEQTASKLTGLAMERKIREALKQHFEGNKEINLLLKKIQKGQLFDGSWGWWEGSRSNVIITNYVTRALLEFRGDALLETNIRNALLFLNNQLPHLDKDNLLESLYTLSEAGHDMDYSGFLKRLEFDSLTQHQQWLMLSVLQKQKLDYTKELQSLMKRKSQTMLGGLYWGEKCFWWSRNDMATTVLAYKTLDHIPGYGQVQKQIIQYFLEQRKEGYWHNTVESASILSAVLPDILQSDSGFTGKTKITVSGDTSFTVTSFPFTVKIGKGNSSITVSKEGGGMVYFTAYQHLFNPVPEAVDSDFRIKSFFEDRNGQPVSVLTAGNKVVMKVKVEALSDAEFVEVTIPIPAGCTYGNKNPGRWNEHREYFKDRVLLFAEQMKKGMYEYEIELEPRYTGSYTINPAKAELMYFPVFYGQTGVKEIQINK